MNSCGHSSHVERLLETEAYVLLQCSDCKNIFRKKLDKESKKEKYLNGKSLDIITKLKRKIK